MIKGLESLNKLDNIINELVCELKKPFELYTKDYGKTELMNDIYKELKALEIIKEKGVDVGYLKTCKTLGDYNSNCWNDEEDFNKKLTQWEFYLLKEVLG